MKIILPQGETIQVGQPVRLRRDDGRLGEAGRVVQIHAGLYQILFYDGCKNWMEPSRFDLTDGQAEREETKL